MSVISGLAIQRQHRRVSVVTPIADKRGHGWNVRFVPKADIRLLSGHALRSTARLGNPHMLFILGQVVCNCEPPRLGADEDMRGRTDGRIVDEGSHGDVDEGAVADDRIKERAAHFLQRVSLPFSSPKIMRLSWPLVMPSLSRSMPAKGLKAAPVARRQFEQWQFAA
jgi:hypothetical protein